MIDAILYIADTAAFNDDDPMPQGAVKTSDGKALIYYRGKTLLDDERVTVLASEPYTGTGTADRIFEQIQGSGDKMALYSSVHSLDPVEIDDGEGGTQTVTPPDKFGMLAESLLPVPKSVTSRQGMQQLIIAGLDEQVESAIDGITDVTQRKLTRAWFHRATDWERDNQQFIALFQALGLTDEQADNHMRAAALL